MLYNAFGSLFIAFFSSSSTAMATQRTAGQTTIDSPAASSKSYSCVICYQRKVKCDRQDPCSNCAKSRAECIYRPPPPPRRRKRSRGNEIVPRGHRDKSWRRDRETRSAQQDAGSVLSTVQSRSTRNAGSSAVMDRNGPGRMITREGNSVYLDRSVVSTPFIQALSN